MPIVYTIICKATDIILADYSDYDGNFQIVSLNLMKKVQTDYRATFCYDDQYYFHYINAGKYNLTFLCMCTKELSPDASFAFLEEVKTLFLDMFQPKEIEKAISQGFQAQFKGPLQGKVNYYNANPMDLDKVALLRKGVMETKNVVLQANDALNERGQKIELIVKKADGLRGESLSFFTKAKKVHSVAKWRVIKIILFGLLIGIIVAYFISVIACGWDWSKCGSSQ